MQCLNPIRIRHPTLENEFLDVPCGKCVACLSRRRQSWVFRLKQELISSMSAYFLTLTYDDEHVPWSDAVSPDGEFTYMCLNKRDLQLFFKRLRKYVKKHFDEPVSLRYFAVGEYGSHTYRPHYHIILFNFPSELNILDALRQTWNLGLTHVGNVTDKSISYVAKYVLCMHDSLISYFDIKPFMLCSKGIGESYLTPDKIIYHKDGLIGYVTLPSGARRSMPRYYRTRIFTEDEQLKLTAELHQYLFDKELHYIRKYGATDEDAAAAGTAMMKSQLKNDYVKNVKRGMTKGRKL